jgi:hypothetical protein
MEAYLCDMVAACTAVLIHGLDYWAPSIIEATTYDMHAYP